MPFFFKGRKNVAIVSPYAGTTRDVLEISLDIGGYPIVLCDTAGLRHSHDPVEKEGLARAKKVASMADLIVMVVDACSIPESLSSAGLDGFIRNECDRLSLPIAPETDFFILVNKSDLTDTLPDWTSENPSVCVMSCRTEKGLDSFLARFEGKLANLCARPQQEAPLITSSRQRHHLQAAVDCLTEFSEMVKHEGDLALAGEFLRKAARQIGYITTGGRIETEEMLDVLFQSFCIGK